MVTALLLMLHLLQGLSMKLISFKCHSEYFNCVLITSMGESLKEINASIDIKYPFSWVNLEFYESHLFPLELINSSIDVPFEVPTDNYYLHDMFNVKIFKGRFEISNEAFTYTFPEFKYVHIGYYDRSQFSLGLGFNTHKDYDTFLDAFYSKGLINRLSFALTEKKGERYIHLSGIPDELLDKKLDKCKVIGRNRGFWDCHLTKAIIQHRTYEINGEVLFDNRNPFIFVPRAFLSDLIQGYFKEALEWKQCWSRSHIYCLEAFYKSLPPIEFVIEGSSYALSANDLFKYVPADEVNGYKFLLRENFEGSWVFGRPFFDKFDIEFDYEDKMITFYSRDKRKIGPSSSMKRLLCCVSAFELAGVALIVYQRRKLYFIVSIE